MGQHRLRNETKVLQLVSSDGHAPRVARYGVRGATDLDEIHRLVIGLVRRLIGNPADVEEIGEYVMAALLRKASADPSLFDRPAEVRRYAKVGAVNRARDLIRLISRREEMQHADADAVEIRDDRPTVLDRMLQAEALLVVDRALRTMPPALREVFALIHARGLTPAEVAALRGTTLQSVYVQASSAMAIVRRAYHQYLAEGTGVPKK